MTSLQGIQASSWSHVHVTPDIILASVYLLALCGIAYDTPPGDARCVCQFSIELCGPGAGLAHAPHPRVAYRALTAAGAAGLQLEHYGCYL